MTQEPILDVADLRIAFRSAGKSIPAVRGLSFNLRRGEILALVGESGCGKSATAQAVMRLLPEPPAEIAGTHALFEGRDLLRLSEAEMRNIRGNRISMIFQDPLSTLNPVMKVGDQIAEVFVRHKGMGWDAARKEAVRMLDLVRIPEAARRASDYPHLFSGGMRQRVAIATAIAARPSVLIADEPTTALDVTIQAQILELIRSLQREEEMAVLFITHDMGVVAEIADRMVVMNGGQAVESGTTEAIFADPREAYTRTLISAVPRLGAMNGFGQPMRFPPPGRIDTPPSELLMPDTVRADERPLIEVRNLSVRFGGRAGLFRATGSSVHAVENVSFSIQPGETLALVGESGCGKSSTGRAIVRLNEPTRGSILLEGRDIAGIRGEDLKRMRRRVQMIFQDPFASLDPRMSVGAAIAEPLVVHRLLDRKSARTRVLELLAQVGLKPEMADRLPHEFSGGQRQRICVARALALEPSLIVADESVSALDVSIKAQVVNMMLELQRKLGLSYLFISHDMAVVERVSHRVAVMYLGEIVEIGPRAEIFGNPRHPYTQRLMAAVPIPDPSRRGELRSVPLNELRSPVRPHGYEPPERVYHEVAPGHLVMKAG
ncbi:ABC transporter ATP-binding protein [uncultured Paracoccus sp.]|uniref:ABC transporter ATP-binding protein n=1 Tax=uncultured Paracoccus sp. TaxID=189685 RepID=UPI0025E01B78|nr:ABC transporter ATP-binding protein [uncultured Paracoccus sp.]